MKKKWIIGIVIAVMLVLGFLGMMNGINKDKQEATTVPVEITTENETLEDLDFDEVTTLAETKKEETKKEETKAQVKYNSKSIRLKSIPKYKGEPYVEINNNKPMFKGKEIKKVSYQKFEKLDSLGRCGVAIASVGRDIMPTKKRGSISSVYPSGWHTYKYENVSGKYLYNRCHLIGHQLTGQNANEKNLITGTRYLNIDGMLPFENQVADYVKSTNNHVMYRVTPVYDGSNLLASGVEMEGYSVEDKGKSISFNVFCYNVQPGVKINYKDGTSTGDGMISTGSGSSNKTYKKSSSSKTKVKPAAKGSYVISINTKKFHKSDCRYVSNIKNSNRQNFNGSRSTLINQGYIPCKVCNP